MLCNSQSKWSWTFLRPGWARSWDNENYIVKDAFVVIVGRTNIEHNIQTLNLWIYVRIKMILQIHLKFLELNCWYFFHLNAWKFDIFTHKKSGQSGKVHWRGNSDHVTSHSQKQFGRTIEPRMY